LNFVMSRKVSDSGAHPKSAPDFVLLGGACQAGLARKDEQITAVSLNLIKDRWVARATLLLRRQSRLRIQQGESLGSPPPHWIELAADENTLFAFEPTNRIVPTTRTRITANITAYSAMSWPSSSRHMFQNILNMFHLLPAKCASRTVSNCEEVEDSRTSRS